MKKIYDLEVELAVRAACFFEEWLALGRGLVEDELEEAFDLGVALRCHTVGMMVAAIGESGCGGSFAPGGWFSEQYGFGKPSGLLREGGPKAIRFCDGAG